MFMRKPALPALALAAALAGTAGLSALPALAQTAPQAQDQAREHQGHHRAFSAARHIDGRIAYMKAELKVTPAQEPQFDRVAQAMRENATAKDQAMQKLRGDRDQPKNAVERLELRQQLAAERAQDSQRFLDAFKPLYASLSDDQKKAADEMLTRHGHHGHGRM
jgi:HPt (histidine-containing phosphotransfer) domain-containing protein